MASKYLQKYPVPEQFPEVLHDFTREILREQPDDIIAFAVEYFQCLSEGKQYVPKSKYNPPKEANKPKTQLEYHSGPGKDIKPREGTAVHKPAPQPVQQVRPPSEKKPVETRPTPPNSQGGMRKPTPPASAKSGKSSHRDQGQQAEPEVQHHEQENEGTQTEPPARPVLVDNSYHVGQGQGETPQGGDHPSVNRTNVLSPKSDAITHPDEKRAAKDYMNDLNYQLENSNQDINPEAQLSQVAHEQEEAALQQAANDTSVNRQQSRPFSGKSGRSAKSAHSQKSDITHKTAKNAAKGYMDELTEGVMARVTPKGTVQMDNGGINNEPTEEQLAQHEAEMGGEERNDSQASPRE